VLVIRLLALLIGLSVAIASCGSAAITPSPATPGPSTAASAPPSPPGPTTAPTAAVSTLAPTVEPSVEPSAEIEPPVETEAPAGSHVAPDLEALLPDTLGEATLDAESDSGDAVLDAWTRVMVTFLADAGKASDDLQFAQAWDAESGLDVSIMAFRVKGIAGSALRQAITDGLLAGSPDLPKSSATVSGKDVTTLTSPEDGWTTYLYDRDDVVFLVGTTDGTLAATVLASLP
jgi:hypothetical protein